MLLADWYGGAWVSGHEGDPVSGLQHTSFVRVSPLGAVDGTSVCSYVSEGIVSSDGSSHVGRLHGTLYQTSIVAGVPTTSSTSSPSAPRPLARQLELSSRIASNLKQKSCRCLILSHMFDIRYLLTTLVGLIQDPKVIFQNSASIFYNR